jgi:hypothetical protein
MSAAVRRTVLVLLCGVFAGALLGTQTAGQLRDPRATRIPLSQPQGWVSFTADLAHREDDGGLEKVFHGRFLRGSDGSERSELTNDDWRTGIVTIKNLTSDTFYTGPLTPNSNKGWTAFSMPVAEIRKKPPVWSDGMLGMSRYHHKVALLKGMSGSLVANDGLDAWIYSNPDGAMRLLVPTLNFFPVVNSSVTGRRLSYTNIVIGPVDQALFEPPPGVPVERASDSAFPPVP